MNQQCCLTRFVGMRSLAPIAVLCGFAASSACGDVVTFGLDPVGAKPNGFVSVESSHVAFFDTVGANLDVFDYSPQSFGNALATNDDTDGSVLEMVFDCPVTDLSLWFGNDDPGFSNPGDLAVLRVYQGATQLGMTTVVLNRDDIINQSIASPAAVVFNRATFAYTNANLSPFTGGGTVNTGLIEIVDDLTFTCVPESGTCLLAALGMAGSLFRRRSRR